MSHDKEYESINHLTIEKIKLEVIKVHPLLNCCVVFVVDFQIIISLPVLCPDK